MNGLLIINKPKGMTSHDVVNIVRKTLHTKKVGHAGTLDPDATGVLVVCVNKATKALQFLTAEHKQYIATLSLGTATDTYDASGTVLEEKPFTGYADLEDVLQSFIGESMQKPPMYSAIKIHGKKLYEYARAGEHIDVPARPIAIQDIRLLKEENNEITFQVDCSKGTYIRSLCVDIAKKLGYPGHMKDLIRTRSGDFTIDQAITLEDLAAGRYTIMPLEEAFASMDRLALEDESIALNGKKIPVNKDHNVAIYNQEGQLLAIYGPDGKGQLKSLRGLF
ncbi:MAG: tRNA pseudouridine(55) synthase TruB [Intestinibaculum porci]|uniref:tRNA pseudouridine(55) synthase TruB n=1 Tax=Intestinibaculum porci TaxID=2487118 RepID=UPI003F054352